MDAAGTPDRAGGDGPAPAAPSSSGAAEAPPPRRRRRLLRLALAALVLALVMIVAGAALSLSYSDQVLVPQSPTSGPSATVEQVGRHRIVLERTEQTDEPGVYGLEWDGGHAIVGPVLASTDGTVTRPLREVQGYLARGVEVRIDPNVFAGNPQTALGLPFRSVEVPDELGGMPAWLVPASRPSPTWAIFVHGINSTRQVGLRIAPALRDAGLTTLMITYREDPEAPRSPDGLHHLGLTEWRDLEAAARYALSHGARRLVLVGYSMGGAVVTQFMEHSRLADRIKALILDAPVLDWRKTLEFNATRQGWPSIAALPLEWAIGARIDVDWDALDALRHTRQLTLPILLFHGTDDQTVPIETSDRLAEALPQSVTYFRVPGAGHCESWNAAPALYERRVVAFLKTLKTARARPKSGPS